MLSSDREILLEINGRLVRLDERVGGLEGRVSRLEETVASMVQDVHDMMIEQRHIHDRIDWLQTTIYWGFALLGIIGAFLPMWRERRQTEPTAPKDDKEFTFSGKLSDLVNALKGLKHLD